MPVSRQEKQLAVHALSQQTPSAQNPDAHCAGSAAEHACPFSFLPHDPFTQVLGATHWLSLVQLEAQLVTPQRKGAHEVDGGGVQRPLTQVLSWVSRLVLTSQVSDRQMVFAG